MKKVFVDGEEMCGFARVAELLGKSYGTVFLWFKNGKMSIPYQELPGKKDNKRVYFRKSDVLSLKKDAESMCSLDDLAILLGRPYYTVRAWVVNGKIDLPYYKGDGTTSKIYFKKKEVDRFIKSTWKGN